MKTITAAYTKFLTVPTLRAVGQPREASLDATPQRGAA